MTALVRLLGPGDDAVLAHVADEVFDNPVDPALAHQFLNDPRHHIVVAIDDGLVVGFASAVHYLHPDKPAELWINEVAVAPSHHRQGLGKAIMRTLLDHGKALGCREAWVLTDSLNDAAMALYVSAGGRAGADEGPADKTIGYSFDL